MLTHAFRQYGKTAAMAATATFGDNPLFVLGHGIAILRTVVLLSIWRMIGARHGMVGDMTLDAVLTYTLVSMVFAGFLSFRTNFAGELWNSAIVTRFLRPMPVFPQYVAEALATWGVGFLLFRLPLLLLAPLLGVNPLPPHFIALPWFLLSLLLAVAVGAALELIFGSLVVALGQGDYAVNSLRMALTVLFSGAVIPLAVMPWGLDRVFGWLPFAAMASAPLRIYTETGPPLPLLAMQLGWCIVLWPLALWIWRSQRERLVTYGG
ncbi:MAG: ABC-2 family transporter protein [Armatimonadota bacterium]